MAEKGSYRVAAGGFRHATNTFADVAACYEAFETPKRYPGLFRGSDMVEGLRGINVPIGGFLQAAEISQAGESVVAVETLPLLWCWAESSGLVTRDAFDRITTAICEDIVRYQAEGPIHGIYLDLFGAMVADGIEDGEAEIIRRVRRVVATGTTVVCSLDGHANISEELVDLTDALAVCRTNSEVDMAETGARAFELLGTALLGVRIQKEWRDIPFLIPLTSQCPLDEPYASIFKDLRALCEHCDILSVDFASGFPLSDAPCSHPSIIVYATDATSAEEAVEQMFDVVVAAEGDFVNRLEPPADAVRLALQTQSFVDRGSKEGPVVLADVQDNPGAGGSCDTMTIVHALIAANASAVVAVVADVTFVNLATTAGVGNTISAALGGKHIPITAMVPSLNACFEILKIGNGSFTCLGETMHGTHIRLGPVVFVRVANTSVRIIVSSTRFEVLDQAIFVHVGVDPTVEEIIVVKSAIGFRNHFDRISCKTILVESPGRCICRTEKLSYCRLRPGLRVSPCGDSFRRNVADIAVELVAGRKRLAPPDDGDYLRSRPEFTVVETIDDTSWPDADSQ